MTRIAILHFSAYPAPGGIEAIIEAQRTALQRAGHAVDLVVGSGGTGEVVRVPLLDPGHPDVRAWTQSTLPPADHPTVIRLRRALGDALAGCDQCWVHNALTVYLNPFLTAALQTMIGDGKRGWAVWCEDLTSVSTFYPGAPPPTAPPATYVTISKYRRMEAARILGLDVEAVRVIHPPLDAAWLPASEQTRRVISAVDPLSAVPLVLVPSKLLPHKGLDRAVRVSSHLRGGLVLITGASSPHQREISASLGQDLRALAAGLGAPAVLLPDLLGEEPDRVTVRDLMLLADLVLVPSVEEGFGMPLQEAASLRVPLLVSDIPPFREAAGPAAEYFDAGEDDAGVAAHIVRMANAPTQAAHRRAVRSGIEFERALAQLVQDVERRHAESVSGSSGKLG